MIKHRPQPKLKSAQKRLASERSHDTQVKPFQDVPVQDNPLVNPILTPANVVFLQRTVGNRAVNRMIHKDHARQEFAPQEDEQQPRAQPVQMRDAPSVALVAHDSAIQRDGGLLSKLKFWEKKPVKPLTQDEQTRKLQLETALQDLDRDVTQDLLQARNKINQHKADQAIQQQVSQAKTGVESSKSAEVRKTGGLIERRVGDYFKNFESALSGHESTFNRQKTAFNTAITARAFDKAHAIIQEMMTTALSIHNAKNDVPRTSHQAQTDVAMEITAAKSGLTKKIDALTWADLRKSISDAAVKLGDLRDNAQKYFSYQMLDLQTINFHIKDTEALIANAKPSGVTVDINAMIAYLKNHDEAKKLLYSSTEPRPEDMVAVLSGTYRGFGVKLIPQQPRARGQLPPPPVRKLLTGNLALVLRLILLYRARTGAVGSTPLPAFTGGYDTIPNDRGRVGRAQWLYQKAFDQYENALALYDRCDTEASKPTKSQTKPDTGQITNIAGFWDAVHKLTADVGSLKSVDKQQVKDESTKYNAKIGMRQMGKGKRVVKQIFAPLLSVGYGLLSGGRKTVKAETGPAGYGTTFKVEDKADQIASAVKEIGQIWGNVGGKGEGMGGAPGRIIFGIFKVVRLIIDVLSGIFGNVGMLATLGSIISTPLAASGYGAAVPGVFASIASAVLIGSLACIGAKAVIDAILLGWSGIAKLGVKDPRARRNMRQVVKSTGKDLAGDVIEGGATVGGVAIGAGVGTAFGGEFGPGFVDAFNPQAAYTGNVMQQGTTISEGYKKTAEIGAGTVSDPLTGLPKEGIGAGLDRIPEKDSDVPDDDLAKPLEKSGGVVTWIIGKLMGISGKQHAGTGAKITRAIDRILKRVGALALDVLGALTLLPALIYDIVKGIYTGVKDYRKAKADQQQEMAKSRTRRGIP